MSELANPGSGQDEFESPSAIAHYCWDAADGAASISMAVPVAERIRQQVVEGFCALPRRGLEVGGVLLGRVARRGPLEVVIDAFEPVPCEHRFGPSFILSEIDRAQLEHILTRPRSQPASSLVGHYRSFTGREVGLDEADEEFIRKHFSDPDQVILAIRPVSLYQCVAWCFARHDGQLPGQPAGPPFPFADGRSAAYWQHREARSELVSEAISEPAGTAQLPEPVPVPSASCPALTRLPQQGREPATQSVFSHSGRFTFIPGGIAEREGRWYSVSEIAGYLGVAIDTVYRWIGHKGLPAHRTGRLWKCKRSEVDAWVRTGGRLREAVPGG